MSIVKKSSAVTAAGVPSENEQPMLTPEEVIDQVRALRDRIPEFAALSKERLTGHMKRVARLNPEFTREAIGMVGSSDVVQVVIGNTPDDLVQAEDEMTRWSLAESEVRTLLHGMSAANLIRRERIARAALEAYNVSRQLARRAEHGHLAPRVEHMSRLPKYGRRRARASAEPQPQLPAPTTKPV
jgi:hypothetical protein